jgi:hypothetical protein
MNIYIVEAQFQTYDHYYEQMVGVFDELKIAEYNKNKWTDFFKLKNEEIFGPFEDKSIRDEDGDWISDEIENDFYRKQSEYRLIFDFRNITIRTLKINEDWINMGYVRTEPQFDLMKQFSIEYNREYNLNKLIDE